MKSQLLVQFILINVILYKLLEFIFTLSLSELSIRQQPVVQLLYKQKYHCMFKFVLTWTYISKPGKGDFESVCSERKGKDALKIQISQKLQVVTCV